MNEGKKSAVTIRPYINYRADVADMLSRTVTELWRKSCDYDEARWTAKAARFSTR